MICSRPVVMSATHCAPDQGGGPAAAWEGQAAGDPVGPSTTDYPPSVIAGTQRPPALG
jgi:hypothetical protein